MQIIFQDPYASLNPRMTVGAIIGEPLVDPQARPRRRRVSRTRIVELLETVGLRRRPHAPLPARVLRRPAPAHRHRARARGQPELIVCDEPVSALDVSIQAQVINLLEDLQQQVRPDLPLHRARPVGRRAHQRPRRGDVPRPDRRDRAGAASSTRTPLHPYTEALLSAVPIPDPTVKRKRILLQGDVPSPINPPSGCHFHTRCPIAQFPLCSTVAPELKQTSEGHWVACHLRG